MATPKLSGPSSAKTRMFYILGGVVALGILGYVGFRYFGGGATGTGASQIASVPGGLQSVPGGKLTPEYAQALANANALAAQQAQTSGGSAVPTLINVPNQPSSGGCTVMCPSDDNPNVQGEISDLVKTGKLPSDDATHLNDLAKKDVTPEEYAAELDRLVKEGKLTPEQARKLLETYKKQHSNALLTQTGKLLDADIKAGTLSLAAANEVLDLQKRKLSPAEYQAELDRMVREGKISPAEAARLMAQYTQQHSGELAKQNAFKLSQMAAAGEITAAVGNQLADLQKKNVSVDDYAAELDRLVKAGKLTPEAAAKLLAQYKQQKLGLAMSGCLGKLISAGGDKAKEGEALLALQSKNASLNEFLAELKKGVAAGQVSPDLAACMLREYQTATAPPIEGTAGSVTTLPGTSDFAKLQQRLAEQQAKQGPGPDQNVDFAALQTQAVTQVQTQEIDNQNQVIADLESAMSGQAQQLISTAWVTPVMEHKGGARDQGMVGPAGMPGESAASSSTSTTTTTTSVGAPIIKAGTIFFAILDTGANSDYPDTPIMATVVQGPFKGAKLLGKIAMAQSQGASQPDRMSLTFNLMNMDAWPTSKTVSAFAIDPDTARTVMASSVDYHYLKRYGAMMATSFLSGYANAIMTAGSTSTTGIFGTSSVHPELSPASKLAVGIGNMGTNLSNIVQNYTTIPPTVKVNAGVGLGILFMSDVTQ